jgi:hypothetical protein
MADGKWQVNAICHRAIGHESRMRFIHLYLIGYFVLVVGAVLALWHAGALSRIGGFWLFVGLLIAVGLGIMLAVTAAKPTITQD